MTAKSQVTPDIDVITNYFPIPGFGLLPINAFVLKATEPMLIDTGAPLNGDGQDNVEAFLAAVRAAIDPADLRWIWITHADMDHVGSLHRLLDEAPQARVVTTFLTVGRMSLFRPLPIERVFLLNPGQSLDLGDRTVTSVRPPSFDAADTAGLFDSKSRTFFSSDCFGALMESPAETAGDIAPEALRQGQLLWATVDSPWLHTVGDAFAGGLKQVQAMDPERILSSHLPPALRMTEQLVGMLASAPAATPFVGPDQAALEAMLAQLTSTEPGAG